MNLTLEAYVEKAELSGGFHVTVRVENIDEAGKPDRTFIIQLPPDEETMADWSVGKRLILEIRPAVRT